MGEGRGARFTLTQSELARVLAPIAGGRPAGDEGRVPPSEPAPAADGRSSGAAAADGRSSGAAVADGRSSGAGAVADGRSSGARRAAVLVPVLWEDGVEAVRDPELLFIVRPLTLSSHSGQVAFPGGVIDPEDVDATAAALREAEEELGIPRAVPTPLGRLPAFATHTGFHVTPIVAAVPREVVLVPSPHEVASHFRVRLSELADPSVRRTMRGGVGGRAADFRLHFWVSTPSPIWGVTGQIVVSLLHALGLESQGGLWR
jgi:8-oxo-dGTP pyrophosphatase MutT (NUDIX family)